MNQSLQRIIKQSSAAEPRLKKSGRSVSKNSTASHPETTGTVQTSPINLKSRLNNASGTGML